MQPRLSRKILSMLLAICLVASFTTLTALGEDSPESGKLFEISIGGANGNQILWDAVPGADSYTLYVFADGLETDPAKAVRIQESVSSGFALQATARTGDLDLPLPHGEFFFRVKAVAAAGESILSDAAPYTPGRRINSAQVHNLIAAFNGNYIIIDTRNLIASEILGGHNVNSIFVPSNNGVNPYPEFEARILHEIKAMPTYNGKDTLIFTHCQGGNRSRPSALFLAEAGYYAFDIGGWNTNNAQPGAPVNVSVPNIFGAENTRRPLTAPSVDFGEIENGVITWPAVSDAAGYEVFAFDKAYIAAQPFETLNIFEPSNNTAFAAFHAAGTATVQPDGENALAFNLSKEFGKTLPAGEYIFRVQAMAGNSGTFSNSVFSAPSEDTYEVTRPAVTATGPASVEHGKDSLVSYTLSMKSMPEVNAMSFTVRIEKAFFYNDGPWYEVLGGFSALGTPYWRDAGDFLESDVVLINAAKASTADLFKVKLYISSLMQEKTTAIEFTNVKLAIAGGGGYVPGDFDVSVATEFLKKYSRFDANRDGFVNLLDISAALDAFMSEPGDENWNPLCDVNTDGIVDIIDLVLIRANFTAGEVGVIVGPNGPGGISYDAPRTAVLR